MTREVFEVSPGRNDWYYGAAIICCWIKSVKLNRRRKVNQFVLPLSRTFLWRILSNLSNRALEAVPKPYSLLFHLPRNRRVQELGGKALWFSHAGNASHDPPSNRAREADLKEVSILFSLAASYLLSPRKRLLLSSLWSSQMPDVSSFQARERDTYAIR